MVKKLFLWFVVNAFLPIFVPIVFLASNVWINEGKFPCFELFKSLTNSGFYIFSASTLVFSIYEEYSICKKCIGIGMQTCLVVLMFLTLVMFLQMYDGYEGYITEHKSQFYVVWGATAISAGIAKFKILKYKQELGYEQR